MSESPIDLTQPIKQPPPLVTQASGGGYSPCQIAGLINAPIIWSINRHASLCFVFYVSAFTAAITVGGLYFMAVQPPNFSHLHSVSLSRPVAHSLPPSLPLSISPSISPCVVPADETVKCEFPASLLHSSISAVCISPSSR